MDAEAVTESAPTNRPAGESDLPALLGNRESSFVPERPLQYLAADIDALFGPALDAADNDLQPAAQGGDLSTLLPPSDPFASLFSNDDREFWETFASTNMDWNGV